MHSLFPNRQSPNRLSLATFALLLIVSHPAWSIKKCKDDQGKWHYGDVAVAACEKSKITILNDRGFIRDELEKPKNAEELKAEQEQLAAEQAEKERLAKIEQERNRILSIYETEDDIDRQRDNQINSLQSNIDVRKAHIKSLEKHILGYDDIIAATSNPAIKKAQIEKKEAAKLRQQKSKQELLKLEKQKKAVMERFDQEKMLYRELKDS